MGKAMSMLSRRIQRFNVENRAHKVISKDKPTPAPRHNSSEKQLEMMKKVDPNFLEKHNTKDASLDERLKDVYLISHETEIAEKSKSANPDRPLPQRRTTTDGFEFGVYEPEVVTKGKCTLRQALQFIESHHKDPAKYTATDIAARFNLNPESTSYVLQHFKMFNLHIPEPKSKDDDKIFMTIQKTQGIKELK